jgi:hypothetical protein
MKGATMGYDIDDVRMRANITTWVPGTNLWHFQRVTATDFFQPMPEGLRGAWYALAEDARVPQTVALLVSCFDDGHWEVNADLTFAKLPHTSKTRHACFTALKEQLARKPEERVLWHSVRDRDLPQFRGGGSPQNGSA